MDIFLHRKTSKHVWNIYYIMVLSNGNGMNSSFRQVTVGTLTLPLTCDVLFISLNLVFLLVNKKIIKADCVTLKIKQNST